jgi:3-hydroxyisobutyrate dehydrogenase-like beta-hydroxyacid dehydrogenase
MISDVGLALVTAKGLGLPATMTSLAEQLYGMVAILGKSRLDFSAVCTLYQEWANL